MQDLQQERPIPPVVTNYYIKTLNPDFRDGLFQPIEFGYRCGKEWVQTVTIENVHEAAVRLTVNEQMEQKFKIYFQMFVVDDEDSSTSAFNMDITEPADFVGDYGHAISDYFKAMQEQYYFFNGYDPVDECNEQIARHGYFYSDGPNYRFRAFEDGWTKAVREFHKSLLLAYTGPL